MEFPQVAMSGWDMGLGCSGRGMSEARVVSRRDARA